ncbi:hypothetical protein DFP72DRAFT_857339 [Ephemerocybe angulata]|uniref:DUF6533 domain-containing protein n=1 Tax=Ephemerocybe angulata TaxID=980116 RepID=A0A8H6LXS5_9AGAR|nr:hypothetical protein DFP72DRAFT_857339 [Tulosesus angulatus]
MSLTPEEISEIISSFSGSLRTEFYYYLTTIPMEVRIMWPRKWHWGKVLFLVNRYLPMLLEGEFTSSFLPRFVPSSIKPSTQPFPASTVIQLRTRDSHWERIWYKLAILRKQRAVVPLSAVERELGYACTWRGQISSANAKGYAIAGYVGLAKALCIFALVLYIFLVRYRKQAGAFKLLHVLRRDSGVYILSVVGIRLGAAAGLAFWPKVGMYNIPGQLQIVVVPVLANRLLLNIWRTEDPEVRKTVSSILFDPPRPEEDSEDDDEEFGDRPIEMVRYEGLGRWRAPAAREESEGTPQGGTGATQAAENGEGV